MRRLWPCLGALAALLFARPAPAEDRVAVRGVYYREPSTRVIQPMVELEKDLPANTSVSAHALVDAITSASVAQGANDGEDIFLYERRSELRLSLAKRFLTGTTVSAVFRHSQEPDYLSDTGGLSLRQSVWQNTGTLGVAIAYGHDRLPRRGSDNKLDVLFAGVAYEQVLSPTLVAQVAYDLTYQNGFFGNPYLRGSFGQETIPSERFRHAPTFRVAWYFPDVSVGLQLHYRFYFDHGSGGISPWGLTAHTIEGRVYKQLSHNVEARVAYRHFRQGRAKFWCNALPQNGGDPGCYRPQEPFKAIDEKYGQLGTHYPELKLTWELRTFDGVPFLGWFSEGTLEMSYGYFIQTTHYGDAHLLQTGYAVPF